MHIEKSSTFAGTPDMMVKVLSVYFHQPKTDHSNLTKISDIVSQGVPQPSPSRVIFLTNFMSEFKRSYHDKISRPFSYVATHIVVS